MTLEAEEGRERNPDARDKRRWAASGGDPAVCGVPDEAPTPRQG